MAKKRIAYWDNLKFVMIVFVVLGHFLKDINPDVTYYKSIYTFIYAFHMPVFFFISGYFFRKKSALENALMYFVYAIFVKFVLFLARFIISLFNPAKTASTFSVIRYNDITWFLIVLAAAEILLYLLDRVNPLAILGISVVIGIAAGYIANIGGNSVAGDYFAWFRILVMFPFVAFGNVMRQGNMVERLRSKKTLRVLAGIIIVAVFLGFMAYPQILDKKNLDAVSALFSGRNGYYVAAKMFTSEAPGVLYKLSGILRYLIYLFSALLVMCWVLVMPDKNIPIVTKGGTRTIQVYTWHYIGVYIISSTVLWKITLNPIGRVLFIFIAIAWAILLTFVNVPPSFQTVKSMKRMK